MENTWHNLTEYCDINICMQVYARHFIQSGDCLNKLWVEKSIVMNIYEVITKLNLIYIYIIIILVCAVSFEYERLMKTWNNLFKAASLYNIYDFLNIRSIVLEHSGYAQKYVIENLFSIKRYPKHSLNTKIFSQAITPHILCTSETYTKPI